MTIFAVVVAASNLILHVGRPWLGFWLFPYPNERGPLWVNFRSPLIWDTFAVSTYLSISLVFWYLGLIPDLAALRDRTKDPIRRKLYDALSLGWVGSAKAWSHMEITAMILAALSTPLVLSVHTIVSFDFAVSILPGWHTTIFPPYFVAGAIFSGFAMVCDSYGNCQRSFQSQKLYYHETLGKHEQDYPRNRYDRGSCLWN
jgi:Ni/Fe-hydrogenase subunit HybB-like protein